MPEEADEVKPQAIYKSKLETVLEDVTGEERDQAMEQLKKEIENLEERD